MTNTDEAPAGPPLHEQTDRDADNVPSAEMRRAVLLWAERFQPGDRWDPEDLRDLHAALTGTVEAHPTAHHRRMAADRDADNVPSDRVRAYAEAMRWGVTFVTEVADREQAVLRDEAQKDRDKAALWAARYDALRSQKAVADREQAALREERDLIRSMHEASGASARDFWQRVEKAEATIARVEALRDRWLDDEMFARAIDLDAALRGPEPTEVRPLPLHRTEAGYPNCSTCDGGGCLDCTDPA